jgi:hypothetical protein
MIHRVFSTGIALGLVIILSRSATADFGHGLLHGIFVPDCIGKRCCDDYQAKPLPPTCQVKQFCRDDYCPKPMPCPLHVQRFCCDDYCPKPWPWIFCPPCSDLSCPPPLRCDKDLPDMLSLPAVPATK